MTSSLSVLKAVERAAGGARDRDQLAGTLERLLNRLHAVSPRKIALHSSTLASSDLPKPGDRLLAEPVWLEWYDAPAPVLAEAPGAACGALVWPFDVEPFRCTLAVSFAGVDSRSGQPLPFPVAVIVQPGTYLGEASIADDLRASYGLPAAAGASAQTLAAMNRHAAVLDEFIVGAAGAPAASLAYRQRRGSRGRWLPETDLEALRLALAASAVWLPVADPLLTHSDDATRRSAEDMRDHVVAYGVAGALRILAAAAAGGIH